MELLLSLGIMNDDKHDAQSWIIVAVINVDFAVLIIIIFIVMLQLILEKFGSC